MQTCLVNNSVNLQQMRKIFYGVNQGTMYYRFMKKIRDQKSHATVPLNKDFGEEENCVNSFADAARAKLQNLI